MRWARVFVTTLVCAVMTACSVGPEAACTDIGGVNHLVFAVDPEVMAQAKAYRIELCQAESCGNVAFAAEPPAGANEIREGVVRVGSSYHVELDAFEFELDAGAATRMLLEARTAGFVTTYELEESFNFEQTYPNGKRCDKDPYLSHLTALRVSDRV